jgi:uncharacterized protein YjiK
MTNSLLARCLAVSLTLLPAGNVSGVGELSFSLTYLDRVSIKDEEVGLEEPSGLALSDGKNALWTVSDDTKSIFKLKLDGELQKDKSFVIAEKGLEGIALNRTGEFLLVIKEDDNEIIKINVDTQAIVDRKRLADMEGFDAVAHYFSGGGANKGLEGITWNEETGTIFVLKEGLPGLLVEVTPDLQSIKSDQLLSEDNGFRDNDVSDDELDFSGICYDQKRSRFWIVSDKAKRLYLYDGKANAVIQSSTLGFGKDGEYREIEKAEGVAVDADSDRLFIVSDEEARLYVFDIR